MANVPVPIPLRDELRERDMVVWSATRTKKGEPISVEIAGPNLNHTLLGWGATIEEAVTVALRSHFYLINATGLTGAVYRLERAMNDLRITVLCTAGNGGVYDDDFVPF